MHGCIYLLILTGENVWLTVTSRESMQGRNDNRTEKKDNLFVGFEPHISCYPGSRHSQLDKKRHLISVLWYDNIHIITLTYFAQFYLFNVKSNLVFYF